MRLGQLSRKLSIKPATIVEEIQSEFNETITEGLNTKIDDKFVSFFEEKYAPVIEKTPITEEVIEEKKEEETVSTPEVNEEAQVVVEEEATTETAIENNTEATVKEEKEESNADAEEEIETIKAPIVKLEGIKIIDKIDLPEPKPQFIEIDGVIVDKAEYKKSQEFKKKEEARKKRALRKENDLKKQMERKLEVKEKVKTPTNHNEFAEQEKARKEKERLAEKRRLANEERERKLRKEHYEKNVAAKLTAPKPKKKKTSPASEEKVKKAEPVVHKNWLAKLIHWFRTED